MGTTDDTCPRACDDGRWGVSVHAERIAPLEATHFWFVGRRRLLRELMARHVATGQGLIVADVGCGTGVFAASLAGAGHSVVAVDLDLPLTLPEGPAYARCDLTSLPFADRTIDVLFVRDVIEHVDDDHAALAECRRVLTTTGILFASVPAWPSLWSQRDVIAGHKRRYTRKSLATSGTNANFRIREIRGYQLWALPIFAIARRAARNSPSRLRHEESLGFSNAILSVITRWELLAGRIRFLRPRTGSTLVLVATPDA